MELSFHAIANEYPMMPAYELGRLEQGMKEGGFDDRFPIVIYQKQILDGRNRWLAAKSAGVKAKFLTFKGSEEEARRFVQKANEERRHLAPDWLKRRREERIERVSAARSEGKSTRAIADEEGVSEKTIRDDLKSATAEGYAVEPQKIRGKDARTYQNPAKKKTPVLADTNDKGEVEPIDAEGHVIPKTCAAAFETLAKFEDIDSHIRQIQALLADIATVSGGEQLRMQLKPTQSGDKTTFRSESLEELKRLVKFCRPHSICPCCQGKALKLCRGCSGHGWVSSVTWKDFDETTKAKLGA